MYGNPSFDHRLVKAIIDNISVEGDKYYIALNKTVANARRGQTLASEVVDLCKALADKHDSPEEPLNALVSKLIKGAEKAHGCSIKTRDELKGVRDALSKVILAVLYFMPSEDFKSFVPYSDIKGHQVGSRFDDRKTHTRFPRSGG